jgi:hypothetical protein
MHRAGRQGELPSLGSGAPGIIPGSTIEKALCFAATIHDTNEAVAEYRWMRDIPLLQDQIPESTR